MKHLYSTTFSTTCQASMPTISQNTPSWSYNRPYHSLVQKTCSPICPNCSPLFDTRHSETPLQPSSPCGCTASSHTPHTNHPSRTQLASHSYSPHLPSFSFPIHSTTSIIHKSTNSNPTHTKNTPFFHFFAGVMGQPLYRHIYFNPLPVL